MAVILLISIAVVIFTMMITYRNKAQISGPEAGIKRSYSTGFLLLIAFMVLALIIVVYTEGI